MSCKYLFEEKKVSECMTILCSVLIIVMALPLSVQAAITQTAVVAMAASDYSSGAHATVSVNPVGGPRTIQENLSPSGSDLTVVSHEKYFYRLERSGAQNVTKFDINSPTTAIWQFSTEGTETGSNSHDLVFLSETKAYLLRYGSPTLWIINPSAIDEAEFKIGEIDLSAYADGDGLPEMNSGVIVNGLLFITIQRIDFSGGWGNYIYNTPWVVVFDTTDDSEVDTGQGDGTRLGIPLPFENPGAIQYVAANNTIYVQGTGQYTADTSGIATINPSTYASDLILDASTHAYGAISGMSIISPSKGYFVGYASWGHNTLYTFNPTDSNPMGTAISGLEDLSIGDMETGAYLDQNGMLWVCASTYDDATFALTEPKIIILDTSNDTVDETIGTNLVPLKVVFSQEGSEATEDSGGDDDSGCFIGGLMP